MKTVTGHKGGQGFNVHVKGFEVHSSLLPDGVSAVLEAGKLLAWVNEVNKEMAAQEPDDVAAMFYPPFTTLHVGKINGGTASNITAKDCYLDVEMRVVPGQDLDAWKDRFRERVAEIDAGMKAVHPEAGIDITPYFDVPGLKPESDGVAETEVRAITGDNGRHVVSYGTEAGQFQEAGYSAVVCGPGDIAQAHQPDEFIEKSQLDAGKDFMERLVNRLSA